MTDAERVDRTLNVQRILYGALLASIGVYVAIAFTIVHLHDPATPIPQPELATAPLSQPLVLALAAMAVVLLVATPIVRAKLMPAREPGDVKTALGRLRAAELASWALSEAIAVFGLMLAFLSYEPSFALGFGGVSALAMLAYAPSRRRVEDVVRHATR